MRLLLISATQEELLALFPPAHLPALDQLQDLFPIAAPKGLFKHEYDVFLCLSGTGPVNAALATGCAVQTLRGQNLPPDHVLNVGLAGAYDLGMSPLCTLCAVQEEIWPEYGLNEGHTVIAEAFKWPLWKKSATESVFDRVTLTLPFDFPSPAKRLKEKVALKKALTVAGVSASFERARTLWDRYHAELENMEGFAVAYACQRLELPCTEIRSVSNKVGPRRGDEKDFPGALKALADILPLLNLI